MKISNNTYNTSPQFCSRFNMNNHITNRSVKALERSISSKRGQEHFFNEFISKVTNNGKDNILELSQFEKHFVLRCSDKTGKFFKIKNSKLIEDIQELVKKKII